MSKELKIMHAQENHLSTNHKIDVSVIIVTYNSADCIQACLESVLKQQEVNSEIIVIDNISSDNTVEKIRQMQGKVKVLLNQQNVGFGRACNKGVEASSGKFIMFLNPDAAFDNNTDLAKLCRVMGENNRWGLSGTTVTEEDGSVDCPPSYSYPKQDRTSRNFSELPGRIGWVFGASMIVKREAFDKAGGFDPEFFLTSEETDLCLRLRECGYEIGFVKEVAVRHIGAASERGKDPYDTWLFRAPGIYRFWTKHYPRKDAYKLIRKDWLRSRYRQTIYYIFSLFAGEKYQIWEKYRRNKGIGDAAGAYLKLMDKNPQVVPSSFPSVTRGI